MPQVNQTKSLNVIGMHCASCASIIKRKLEGLSGIEKCEVNSGTEKAQVTYNPQKVSLSRMNQEIDKLGYSLEVSSQPQNVTQEHDQMDHTQMDPSFHAGHDMMTPISSDASIKARKLQELNQLATHIKITVPLIAVSVFKMIWEVGANPLGLWSAMSLNAQNFFHYLLPIFATYVLFVIGLPYLQGVWRFIKYRVANMDTLVGIGTSVAYIYSFVLSAFSIQLAPFLNTQHTYYDVVIVVIGFITIGKYFEARSKLKTGEAIEKLLGLQVKTALVIRKGEQVEISIEQVVVGDILIVKPGQKIPVDGEIVDGATSIDESMITGESIPVDKKLHDVVIGATINKQGSLKIKATKVGKDTMLSQIITMVETAQGSKAPIEHLADQISSVFVPVVLVFAIITLVLWLIIGSQFMPFSQALTLGITSFVGILVIACPCAMGLATPTAVIVGVGKAAQNGILIKNAESLQKLSGVNYLVMDKTGTLTKGMPEVTDILSTSDLTNNQILQLVASLERHSEHPLAQAVVNKNQLEKQSFLDVKDFLAIEGKGLRGSLDGQMYLVGNTSLVADLGLTADSKIISNFTSQGKTPVVLAGKQQILGYLAIADTIKDDAVQVVARLHQQGIKVAMLTGDHQQTASYIADQIGIDTVIAEVLPGGKAKEINKLHSTGLKVAMAGDGINDAPALATADVGIAMGTGTDVAIESADITLLGGHISALPKAIVLSRATMRTIKQNLFWAFFYNVIGIPIAAGLLYPIFGILLNPALAGSAMAFSSVSVVLNALKLKRLNLLQEPI